MHAAADLADERGTVDNLQLVELAERLSVRTPSLYAHVESLEDVRRGIALIALADMREILSHAASGHSGADALLAMARAIRSYAREHPGRYSAGAAPPRDKDWHEVQRTVRAVFVTVLARHGLSDDDATEFIRALRAAIHGFVTLELQGDFGGPDRAASFDRIMRILLKGLLDEFPGLAAERRRLRAAST
jgi:hypothetical protein